MSYSKSFDCRDSYWCDQKGRVRSERALGNPLETEVLLPDWKLNLSVLHGYGQADRGSAPGHAQSQQHHDYGSGCHGLTPLWIAVSPLERKIRDAFPLLTHLQKVVPE